MMAMALCGAELIFESLRAGATGYLLRSQAPTKLLKAIRDVAVKRLSVLLALS
jgi:DNA-binding NarL/FixJ family response regulator